MACGGLNRIRREGISGTALLENLSQVYHLYGLERAQEDFSSDKDGYSGVRNDELPQIGCSEALQEAP